MGVSRKGLHCHLCSFPSVGDFRLDKDFLEVSEIRLLHALQIINLGGLVLYKLFRSFIE